MGTRGPAPNPQALRRSKDGHAWTRLPRHGLTAEHEVPSWPAEIPPAVAEERALWTRLWRTKPQAWAWLDFDLVDQVAMYVRFFLHCAQYPDQVAAQGELRRQVALLLLDIPSLTRERYLIDDTVTGAPIKGLEAPEKANAQVGNVRQLPSARDRMQGTR